VTLWVLGDTKFRINLCDSGTSLKHKVSANILPVDVVLHYFNFGFTSVVSW
jgi:isocitrate dehydrogenase kinase/phosphatase